MEATYVKPDVILFLDNTPQAYLNMMRRGRACEKAVTFEYLDALRFKYLKMFESDEENVYCINWPQIGLMAIEEILGSHGIRGIW
jgi:thymidylate kinase